MDEIVGSASLEITARKVAADDPKASLAASDLAEQEFPTLGALKETIESALGSAFPGLTFNVGEIERTDK